MNQAVLFKHELCMLFFFCPLFSVPGSQHKYKLFAGKLACVSFCFLCSIERRSRERERRVRTGRTQTGPDNGLRCKRLAGRPALGSLLRSKREGKEEEEKVVFPLILLLVPPHCVSVEGEQEQEKKEQTALGAGHERRVKKRRLLPTAKQSHCISYVYVVHAQFERMHSLRTVCASPFHLH